MSGQKPVKRKGLGNPKRGRRIVAEDWPPTVDPLSLASLSLEHLQWLAVHGYAERTVETRKLHLSAFLKWCLERGLESPSAVTLPMLERYQRHLYQRRKPDGSAALSLKTQRGQLTTVQQLFKWLTRQKYILSNPASELELPRVEKRLPRVILTASQVEQVMNVPDLTCPVGLRDRAILEALYSTGIRRAELINLELDDIVEERGLLLVREGKGKKDRMVPIGQRALVWLRKYIDDVRPALVCSLSGKRLFLTEYGEPLLPKHLSYRVRSHIRKADIGLSGSCHIFRHSMATLMLENGADIRFIQRMLGHSCLESTEVYTHVSVTQLKKVHELTHPTNVKEA